MGNRKDARREEDSDAVTEEVGKASKPPSCAAIDVYPNAGWCSRLSEFPSVFWGRGGASMHHCVWGSRGGAAACGVTRGEEAELARNKNSVGPRCLPPRPLRVKRD